MSNRIAVSKERTSDIILTVNHSSLGGFTLIKVICLQFNRPGPCLNPRTPSIYMLDKDGYSCSSGHGRPSPIFTLQVVYMDLQ